MIRKSVERGFEFGVFVVVLLSAFYFLSGFGYFDLDVLKEVVVGSGWTGILIFVFSFIVLALFGVSVTPLIIFAGVLFGYNYGFAISFVSLFVTSILAFYISNFISHQFLKRYHPAYHFKFHILDRVIEKLESTVEKNCFKTVFLSKFVIANVIVSYALGTISERINKVSFVFATLLNNFIYCLLLIFLGVKFTENLHYLFLAVIFVLGFYFVRGNVKKYFLHRD